VSSRLLDACPLCAGRSIAAKYDTTDEELQLTHERFSVWKCAGCESFFLNPMPRPDELASFYPQTDGYRAYAVPQVAPLSSVAAWVLRHPSPVGLSSLVGVDNRIADLARVQQRLRLNFRRVLDVGCGAGYFSLMLVRQLGIAPDAVLGIDIHPRARELGEQIGLRFETRQLSEVGERSFDLISMSHVLEHVPDPRGYLVEAAKRLAPGGLLMISVPNALSLPARLMGKPWVCHSVPRHLYAFSREGVLAAAPRELTVEAWSADDVYTFMLGRYYHPLLGRIAARIPIGPLRAALAAAGAGDNLSFVLRRA
jgi:SAM-dependent methyltransferase